MALVTNIYIVLVLVEYQNGLTVQNSTVHVL